METENKTESVLDASADEHKRILTFEYSTHNDPEKGIQGGGCACGKCEPSAILDREGLYKSILNTLEAMPLDVVAKTDQALREATMMQMMLAAAKDGEIGGKLGAVLNMLNAMEGGSPEAILMAMGAPMPPVPEPTIPDEEG